MTSSPSSSQQLTFRDQNFLFKAKVDLFGDHQVYAVATLSNAMRNAPIHTAGVYRIPIAPLLDELRRITGNEDEADRAMQFVRDNIGPDNCAEIGRVGDDDANYIIIYPRNHRPADFKKSKTNTLTVVDLVKVALYSLQNEVKPYQTINGVKVTRSNLSTARQIAEVIRDEIPNIKIMHFADKYSVAQLSTLIATLESIKKKKDRENAILILKANKFSDEQIAQIIAAS